MTTQAIAPTGFQDYVINPMNAQGTFNPPNPYTTPEAQTAAEQSPLSPLAQPQEDAFVPAQEDAQPQMIEEPTAPEKKPLDKKKIALIAAGVLAVAAGIFLAVKGGKGKEGTTPLDSITKEDDIYDAFKRSLLKLFKK